MDNPLRSLFLRPRKFISQFVSKGDRVADVGCGPGFFALPMAEVVGHEGKVYAIDSDEKSIKKLLLKSSKLGYRNIEARVESAARLDSIGDRSLDFLLSNLVLCCMVDHEGAVREIKRTLKSDGSAYLSVVRPFGRKDPKKVGREEWRATLEGFLIKKERSSITVRSAVVSLRA